MNDSRKTKKQLINELNSLRSKITGFNSPEFSGRISEQKDDQSQIKYRGLLDHVPAGVTMTSAATGEIFYVNNAALNIFEFDSKEEFLSQKSSTSWRYPDDRDKFVKLLKASGFVQDFEAETITNKNKIKTVIITSKIEEDTILSTMLDITKRVLAESTLKESEEKYRNLFESMAQGVFYQKNSGEFIDVNNATLEMFGLTREQFFGRDIYGPRWKVIKEDYSLIQSEEYPSIISLRTGKEIKNYILGIFNSKKNDYSWLSVNTKPQFRENENKPYRVFVTIHDITERKKSEEEMQKIKDQLEIKVSEKTIELQNRISELERFHDAKINRELRMKELHDKINELENKIKDNPH